MANVDKLLHGAQGGVDLLAKLELLADEQGKLQKAKRKIRDHLRAVIATETKRQFGRQIIPRFFTQGSEAYKLLNRRAWMPPQQIDVDDGLYLPMTFVKGNGPTEAAILYFAIVDAALKVLIEREKWKGFEEKDTCARVIIDDCLHVDVPLYAIPDDQFGRLTKAAMDMAIADSEDNIDFMSSRKMRIESWDQVDSDKVLLAHRKENWKPSDPRKIHDWFLNAIDFYGELLRRECRYLKAWRDHHKLDHVSSIILMACAFYAFEDVGHLSVPRRDDLALLEVTSRLADMFSGEILNPAETTEVLGSSWTREQRQQAIKAANAMHEQLDDAINHCYLPEVAVDHLKAIFGERIPNRPDLVKAHAAAAAAVVAAPAIISPAPSVGRSTSG
ncbi:CBASS cGAMP synthase [Bradyrhizobium sp. USDA 4506]